MYDRGIPVIAGLANENIATNAKTWPNCLDKVINVGAETPSWKVGIGANGIDYYAKDTIYFGRNREQGNSLAAPRIAGAFALLHEATPFATVQEKMDALDQANSRMSYHKVGSNNITARHVLESDIPEAIRILRLSYPEDIPEETIIAAGQLNYIDTNEYGPRYGGSDSDYILDINFDELHTILTSRSTNLSTTAINGTSLSGRRDVILKFTGSFTSPGSKSFVVKINGTPRFTVNKYYSSGEEEDFTINIHRKYFSSGNNTITIEPRNSSYNWGLKDISAEFTPVVPLTIGQTDNNEYGYYGSPQRFTGARASFELTDTNADLLLSVVGWDIDAVDETNIFINGFYVGNLTQGTGSSAYSAPDQFLLRKNYLYNGLNYIEFVQREIDGTWSGEEDEKWAVKDLLVETAPPDLTVSSLSIIDKSLKVNIPFDVSVSVHNNGAGYSDDTLLQFYVSADENISTGDTLILSQNFAELAPNDTRIIDTSVQSTQVNQGYFLGTCVVVLGNETNTNNNCSLGIPLKNNFNFVPILFFLLMSD